MLSFLWSYVVVVVVLVCNACRSLCMYQWPRLAVVPLVSRISFFSCLSFVLDLVSSFRVSLSRRVFFFLFLCFLMQPHLTQSIIKFFKKFKKFRKETRWTLRRNDGMNEKKKKKNDSSVRLMHDNRRRCKTSDR
ncbi:hypothetical protein F5X96DRAFT_650433 [Biscogniauxia mediterranea]|nr:hypothetical protein F5X96DRAFT_650433 [Biscogniauxia mediterranea]